MYPAEGKGSPEHSASTGVSRDINAIEQDRYTPVAAAASTSPVFAAR